MKRGTAWKAALAITAALLLAGQTDAPIEGAWQENGNWVQTPILHQCTQAWTCVPKQPIIYPGEMKLVGPGKEVTIGSCDAAGGPIDSCNACRVLPPSTPCSLTLEPR